MKNVTIYTTPVCPYCVRAKSLLQRKDIPYTEIDVAQDEERRAWLIKATGRRTVPQIFIGDQPVGGCDDLYELDRTGKLAEILADS